MWQKETIPTISSLAALRKSSKALTIQIKFKTKRNILSYQKKKAWKQLLKEKALHASYLLEIFCF